MPASLAPFARSAFSLPILPLESRHLPVRWTSGLIPPAMDKKQGRKIWKFSLDGLPFLVSFNLVEARAATRPHFEREPGIHNRRARATVAHRRHGGSCTSCRKARCVVSIHLAFIERIVLRTSESKLERGLRGRPRPTASRGRANSGSRSFSWSSKNRRRKA